MPLSYIPNPALREAVEAGDFVADRADDVHHLLHSMEQVVRDYEGKPMPSSVRDTIVRLESSLAWELGQPW
jgi:hypothetical protein